MQKATTSNTKVRKITKFAGGTSYGVIIPIEFVRHLKWKERQKVTVTLAGKNLVIEDWSE